MFYPIYDINFVTRCHKVKGECCMMYIAILLVILACNSVFMYACLIVAKRADQDEEIMFQKRINEKAGEK
mgnify:FL=1